MGRLRGSIGQDSRRARLSRVIAEWQRQGQTRFSFAELLARYAAAYPGDRATHDSLTSAVSALVHAGELTREPGAGRRLLYVPRRPSNVGGDDATLAHNVVDIVESHYEARHSPIPTAAISAELKRRSLWPDRFARLSRLLQRLAGEADTEADALGLSLPAIQRADARTLIGEAVAFWVPVGVPAQCATAPSSSADALRRAVAAAAPSLGRPVSKRELRWWLDAQPVWSPLREMLEPSRVGPHLQHTGDRDAAYLPSPGRLQVVDGPLTCHGGPPRRYLHRSPSSQELAACQLEDAVLTIRPATELAGIEKLESYARTLRSPILGEVMRVRRHLVAHALRAYAGGDIRASGRCVGSSFDALEHWIDQSSLSYAARYSRRRQVAEAREELTAALRVVAGSELVLRRGRTKRSPAPGAPATRYVGQAGLVSVTAVRDFAVRAARAADLDAPRPELTYARARRFPNPASATQPGTDSLALLDRADAVLAVFGAAQAGRAMALLVSAQLVLGEVLRDTGFLQEQLGRARAGHVRRPLALASALLGECPDLKLVAPDAGDAENVRAYILAALVSDVEADRVYDRVLECARRSRGTARAVTRRALKALESGRLLSIVE
jgi:hypothetical protein